MMNLIIDIGNTKTKTAVFENGTEVISYTYNKLNLKSLLNILKKNNIEDRIKGVIICTVSYLPMDIIDFFSKKNITFILFDAHTPIPLKNLYKTPESLGKDRLASAVAANHIFKNSNVLCIDMGTCIKYDFVNTRNEYLGGAISPGIDMRLKALNTFTQKLPLVNKKKFKFLIGQNTEESILSGVFNGVSAEIADIIRSYIKKYADLKIILSGGDMKNFDNKLKISIFAVKNIVNYGLNLILEYNKPKNN